jgi:hypothetical protein
MSSATSSQRSLKKFYRDSVKAGGFASGQGVHNFLEFQGRKGAREEVVVSRADHHGNGLKDARSNCGGGGGELCRAVTLIEVPVVIIYVIGDFVVVREGHTVLEQFLDELTRLKTFGYFEEVFVTAVCYLNPRSLADVGCCVQFGRSNLLKLLLCLV